MSELNELAVIVTCCAVAGLILVVAVLYGMRQATNGLSAQANQMRRQAREEKPYIITASYSHSTAGDAEPNEGPHAPRRNYFNPPRVTHEPPPLGPLGLFGVDPNDHIPSIFLPAVSTHPDEMARGDVELSRILSSAPNLTVPPPMRSNEQILAAQQPKAEPIEAHFKEPPKFGDTDVEITNYWLAPLPRVDGRPPLTKDNQE